MDPPRAGRLPGERGRERLAVVRLGAGFALHQAHRLAAGDVDRGQQFERGHARVSSQLRNSCGTGVAGLLRVELGAGHQAVFDRGDERSTVTAPS